MREYVESMEMLFPGSLDKGGYKYKHPYYIVAPKYIEESAGIRALHILCHSLNSIGANAYIYIDDEYNFDRPLIALNLRTKILTEQIVAQHRSEKLNPITIYPDVTTENVLNSKLIVRYLLYYCGKLTSSAIAFKPIYNIAYSKKLAEAHGISDDNVLFIPTSDPIFFSPPAEENRVLTCSYLGKYREVYNGKPFPISRNSIEITRGKTKSQTRVEYRDILRKSKLLYCYDNSAVAIEAILCGCPTIFLPSQWLKESLSAHEIGIDGYAWGSDSEEVEKAKETVIQGRRNYLNAIEKIYPKQLDLFISKSQQLANEKESNDAITLPKYHNSYNYMHKLTSGKVLKINRYKRRSKVSTFNFIRRKAGVIEALNYLRSHGNNR